MRTITIADVVFVTIAKVNSVEVNLELFNSEVVEYIFNYGLKQVLNDAGSAGKDADEKLAMANVKLAALYEGKLRKAREAGEPADPIGKEAYRIAGELVTKLLGRIYKGEWKCPDMAKARAFAAKHELDLSDAETFLGEARKIVAKSDRVRAEAKANVETASALADLI